MGLSGKQMESYEKKQTFNPDAVLVGTIGSRIKFYRERNGMSQAVLADYLKFSQASMSMIENDKYKPNKDTLRKIASKLGVEEWQITGIDKQAVKQKDKYISTNDINVLLSKPPEIEADLTSHAPHYHAGTPYEVYKVLEAWDLPHHLASAIEYIARHNLKGTAVSDLKKAKWRIEKMIELLERNAK